MNVYDFDGTIYNGDSTLDFYWFCMKKNPYIIRRIPVQLLAIFRYKIGRISKTEMKEVFFIFLKDIKDIESVVLEFWELKKNNIFSWYLKQKKGDDVIISASPFFLLKPICDQLQLSQLIASNVDMKNGKFEGENCYGKEKVRRFIEEYDLQIAPDEFYTDSWSDKPMIEISKDAFICKKGKVSKIN